MAEQFGLEWLTATMRHLAPDDVPAVAVPLDQLARYRGRHRLEDMDVHLPRRQHMRPDEVAAYTSARVKLLHQQRATGG